MDDSPSILVTGGSGFTGRYFVPAAASRGYRCIVGVNDLGAAVEGAERELRLDLTDRGSVNSVINEARADYILHLAAVSFVGHDDLAQIYLTNVVGTINLLEAALIASRTPKKIVIASSGNVYGNATILPIDEDSPFRPQNDYAVSKVAMELAARVRSAGCKIILVRPFNYTGVGQAQHFLIPKIVRAYVERRPELELGNLEVSRDFSDVRDVAAAYMGLLASDVHGVTVNICSGQAASLSRILDMMSSISGHSLVVRSVSSLVRGNEIPVLFGTDERLRSIIGDYRRYTFEDTLRWMYHADK